MATQNAGNAVNAAKEKALQQALDQIQKQYGKGAIMRLGESGPVSNIDVISTGSVSLDFATGVGGYPKGRIIEIYGPESSGKTTLTLHAIAEAQRNGGQAAFIDAEHALDPVYAKNLGVNVDELLVSQPDTGEQALEICEMLTRSGAVDIIVIDSVAALVPKAEIQGDMGDSHVGLQARLMSQALRKMFGNPETTTGGRALKFYASMRLDVRKIDTIKKGEDVLGNRTRVKIVKNKVAPPFRKAEFDIMYGTGISLSGDILDLASDVGIIDKSGSWYSYKNERIGQGRENVKAYLEANPDVLEEIRGKLMQHLMGTDEDGLKVDEDGVVIE